MRDAVHAHQPTAAGRVSVTHARAETARSDTAALRKPVAGGQGSIGTPAPRPLHLERAR